MFNRLTGIGAICLTVVAATAGAPSALSDAISPQIGTDGTEYSTEKPDTSFYGTGVSGRMAEASSLRFTGDRLIQDQKFDEAIKVLSKAVQLDPGDPTGHLMYARALSSKIYTSKKAPSLELVNRGLQEWHLLWRHDADLSEQFEAHAQFRRMSKLAKILEKQQKHGDDTQPQNMVAQGHGVRQ